MCACCEDIDALNINGSSTYILYAENTWNKPVGEVVLQNTQQLVYF